MKQCNRNIYLKIKKCIAFLVILLCTSSLFSQEIIPLSRDLYLRIDKSLYSKGTDFHSAVKPYLRSEADKHTNTDSLLMINRKRNLKEISWFHRKLRYQSFVSVDTTDFKLRVDPLFNLEMSKQKDYNKSLYNNTRGVYLQGQIGKYVAFNSCFYENQSVFNEYVDEFAKKYKVVPGQGYPKNFGTGGYDYSSSMGVLSVNLAKYFNIQFGHGKNFIGDGYRSLLLSDNSFSYPFLKITTNIWKLQYTNLYTSFQDLNAPHSYESGFQKKYGTFHHLSYNVTKWLNIGLFEGIVWQAKDSTGNRGFDINYLNPIIYYRPVEYSLSSPDNALIGLNTKITFAKKSYLYGQFVLDDLDIGGSKKGDGYILNKYGYQAGIVNFDLFGLNGLTFQVEYNQVQPYVYAHKTPLQNYSHYNQALAHPLGANFKEGILLIDYKIKDFTVGFQYNYAIYGADTNGTHWGNDIFQSDFDAQRGFPSYGNKILQGLKTTINYWDAHISYLINPRTNMNLVLGIARRTMTSDLNDKSANLVYFGFRTSLTNLYYDF